MKAECPICGDGYFKGIRDIVSDLERIPEGLDRSFVVHANIERCASCGLYRTMHRSENRLGSELYQEDSICFDASVSKVHAAQARSVSSTDELSLLITRPPARLLDVGCGAGQFLLRACEAGYRGTGIDLDPRAVAFARDELGLDVRSASLDQLPLEEKFDIVTMFGVLEHIAEPLDFLRSIRQRISSGGEILIGVPNVASLNRWISRLSRHDWDMFLEPGHLYHYDIRTLTALCARAALQLRHWATGTITIRGKVPFFPSRNVSLERAVQRAVATHGTIRELYIAGLRVLDIFRTGDMLFANFQVGTTG